MEVGAIIGLISSVITIEEASRSWFGICKKYRVKKEKINFDSLDVKDEVIKSALDNVLSGLVTIGVDVLEFTEEEISQCKKEFKESLSYKLGYKEKKEIDDYIDQIFIELKKYVNKNMTLGEKRICKELSETRKDIQGLTEQFNKNIKCVSDEKIDSQIYIKKVAKYPASQFSYRENEIQEILSIYNKYCNICIYGIGGIGKTSILKYLYNNIKDENKMSIWMEYSGDLKNDLLSVIHMPEKLMLQERESLLKTFIEKNSSKLVLFIDNVDERIKKDAYLEELGVDTKVIVTSRIDHIKDSFYMYKIETLASDKAVDIFWKYYGKQKVEYKQFVEKMLNRVKYHTLLTELIAKAAKYSGETLMGFSKKFLNDGYEAIKEIIETNYNNIEGTLVEHVSVLFSIIGMDELEKKILKNFAIAPSEPLDNEFLKWIVYDEDKYANAHRNLVLKGWINKTDDDMYEMHPVIKEAILLQEKIQMADIKELLETMLTDCWLSSNDSVDVFLNRFCIVDSVINYFSIEDSAEIKKLIIKNIFILTSYCMFDKAYKYWNLNYAHDLKVYGQDSKEVIYDYFDIANLYNEANKLDEAEKYTNLALNNLKGDGLKIRRLKYQLEFLMGAIYAKQGKYDLAVDKYNGISNVYGDVMDERDKIGLSFNKFALMIDENRFDEAYMIMSDVMEKIRIGYGEESWEMATFYQNCANLYFEGYSDYYKALDYDEKALKIRQKKQEKHVETAQSFYSIAADFYAINKRENDKLCKKYAKKAYDIWKELLGQDNKKTETARILLEMIES